jgi:hypothetical protein
MKLEKFDLEKALNGAKVVTRDGREVQQLTKFEGSTDYQLAGVMDGNLQTWTEQGGYYTDRESDLDLFLTVKPKRIWVNVYIFHNTLQIGGRTYNTLKAAKKSIGQNPNYIKTIEITDEP